MPTAVKAGSQQVHIWLRAEGVAVLAAHIGFDRLLGYGLKHPTGFHYTHLGVIGRRGAAEIES